jgi:hypothetical protein
MLLSKKSAQAPSQQPILLASSLSSIYHPLLVDT